MPFELDLVETASTLLDVCRRAGLTIATAESCTGGLVAALLTEIPGSSDVFDRGFVTYSNAAKQDLLGVPGDLLADFGAVSEPVARAMAEGALNFSSAKISIAITGVAGPGGGTALKPVGSSIWRPRVAAAAICGRPSISARSAGRRSVRPRSGRRWP